MHRGVEPLIQDVDLGPIEEEEFHGGCLSLNSEFLSFLFQKNKHSVQPGGEPSCRHEHR